MLELLDDVGRCPICGAAHAGCVGDRDDSTGVGVTRGVIVIQQLPTREGAPAVEGQAAAAPAAAASRNQARPRRRRGDGDVR